MEKGKFTGLRDKLGDPICVGDVLDVKKGIIMEKMNNHEFFEAWSRCTDFFVEIEIAKLRIFRGIRNNLACEDIQRIIDWEKPRILDHYDEGGYCELCSRITDLFSMFAPNSSSVQHEMYAFTSEAILFLADQNKALQKQIKRDQIKKLQEQIKKLESESK